MLLKDALSVDAAKCISPESDPVKEYQLRGDIRDLTFNDDNFLEVMYKAIDTNIIERIEIPSIGVTMWLDEEGKLKQSTEINIDASIIYQVEYQQTSDFILGNVVFTSVRVDDEGYTMGLNAEEKAKLKGLLGVLQNSRPEKGFLTRVLDTEPRGGFIG